MSKCTEVISGSLLTTLWAIIRRADIISEESKTLIHEVLEEAFGPLKHITEWKYESRGRSMPPHFTVTYLDVVPLK